VAAGLPFEPLVAKVNGEMWDLVRPFEVAENDVELLTPPVFSHQATVRF